MANQTAPEARELVVVITRGIDHELSSAGMIVALGGMTAGLKVSIFLTSSGVDIVRRGAADTTHVKPLEPLADMLRDFLARGRTLWACTPCVKRRGHAQLLSDRPPAGNPPASSAPSTLPPAATSTAAP